MNVPGEQRGWPQKTQDARSVAGARGKKPPCLETPTSARACELAMLVLDCRAEGWPAMNDLSAFDGDAERERQFCDLRIRGKTEAEVCQMLGCTAPIRSGTGKNNPSR
jgi:hypothetical protein